MQTYNEGEFYENVTKIINIENGSLNALIKNEQMHIMKVYE